MWSANEVGDGVLSKTKNSLGGLNGLGPTGQCYNIIFAMTPSGSISSTRGTETKPNNVTIEL